MRLLESFYDVPIVREKMINSLKEHLQKEETVQRWIADTCRFCKDFLRLSNPYHLYDDDWDGEPESVALSPSNITVADLRPSLRFHKKRLEEITSTFQGWDGASWMSDMLNFKMWLEDNFIDMWIEDELARIVASFFDDPPWSMPSAGVYRDILKYENFRSEVAHLMEHIEILDQQIESLVRKALAARNGTTNSLPE